jgi:AraC-like DNA-binding protein
MKNWHSHDYQLGRRRWSCDIGIIWIKRVAAGFDVPSHFHDSAHLSMLIKGDAHEEILSNHQWRSFERKSSLISFCPAGQRHKLRFSNNTTVSLVIELSTQFQTHLASADIQTTRRFDQSIDACSQLRLMKGIFCNDFYMVESELLSWMEQSPKATCTTQHWLRQIYEEAADSNQPRPLLSIAKTLGTDPSLLSRQFKTAFGYTYGEVVRSARLQRLAADLISESATLVDLSNQHGFSDQSHMGRWTQRQLGVSPSILSGLLSAEKNIN